MAADQLDDIEIKLGGEMGILQHGDKHPGGDHSIDGVTPSGKCLQPADLARHRADLGLIEHLDVPGVPSLLK